MNEGILYLCVKGCQVSFHTFNFPYHVKPYKGKRSKRENKTNPLPSKIRALEEKIRG